MGKALKFALDQNWAILPETLALILDVAQRNSGDIDAVAAKIGRPLENTRSVVMRDNIAIIPIHGPIFRYANMFTMISGAVSIDMLATDLTKAIEDQLVDGIVLDIDSPGGMVSGISEFSAMVRKSEKPIEAYVSNYGASAGYWIASSAHRVTVADTAELGSIGVVATVRTGKAENEIEIVSSNAPNKRVDAKTDEGRAQILAVIDKIESVFISSVAKYRGVDVQTVKSDFGAGGLLVGEDAVDAGMADSVGSLESVIAGLAGNSKRGIFDMGEKNTSAPETSPEITRNFLAANYPALVEDIKTEGYELGHADGLEVGTNAGAEKERARIKDVEAQSMPGHEELIASLKFDGETTGAEAAVAVLSAEKKARQGNAGAFDGENVSGIMSTAGAESMVEGGSDVDENLTLEEKCKIAWDKSKDLRSEFGNDFDKFIAFERACEAGNVKYLKQKEGK